MILLNFFKKQVIAYVSKKITGTMLDSQMNIHNHIKNINFMAIGYRIAFLRFDKRLKNTLMITKFIWKIINYLAMPLGL